MRLNLSTWHVFAVDTDGNTYTRIYQKWDRSLAILDLTTIVEDDGTCIIFDTWAVELVDALAL